MLKMAEKIAMNHHEHWDGGGYPAGLAGYAIPESARIAANVDVYDALTHDRVYRPALPEEKALNMMQHGAGTHFDPHLLAVFFLHLPEMSRVCEENPDESPDMLVHPFIPEYSGDCFPQPSDPPVRSTEKI
jgi:putative two-component system response regulator